MASSVPYAAPYTRSTARARPAVHMDSQPVRFLGVCLALVLVYVLAQLALASVASATLTELDRLDKAIAAGKLERDVLVAQVEDLKNPAIVEAWALRNGYVPATSIEFVP